MKRVERALISVTDKRGLVDFAAEAFFFPAASKQKLSWAWDIAGTPVSTSVSDPYRASIDTSTFAPGATPLTLLVKYAKPLIPQSASRTINLLLQ